MFRRSPSFVVVVLTDQFLYCLGEILGILHFGVVVFGDHRVAYAVDVHVDVGVHGVHGRIELVVRGGVSTLASLATRLHTGFLVLHAH